MKKTALISFNNFFGGLLVIKHEDKPLTGLNDVIHRELALPVGPEDHQFVQAVSSHGTQTVDFLVSSDLYLKAPLQHIFFQIGLVDDADKHGFVDLKGVLPFKEPV